MSRSIKSTIAAIAIALLPTSLYAAPESVIAAEVPDFLRGLYQTHQFAPLWVENGKTTQRLDVALTAMENATEDGLHPEDYGIVALREQQTSLNQSEPHDTQIALFDLAVSTAFLHFAGDMAVGRVNPAQFGLSVDLPAKRAQLSLLFAQALQTQPIETILATLPPSIPLYNDLKILLKQTRLFAKQYPGEPALPALPGKKLEPGQSWAGCPALADWLVILGDMPINSWPADKTVYEDELVDAVKRFQVRHGLEEDGVIGNQSDLALRVSLPERVTQIELAMERLRWLDRNLENERFLLVNIPQFTLFGFEPGTPDQQPALVIRVVVGKAGKNETPLLSRQMSHVIFSPYWNVPRSIAMKEILPKWRHDPHYIAGQNMELVDASGHVYQGEMGSQAQGDLVMGDYRLRQRPGKENALGGIKFMFPNDDSIYMHDTPQQRLFQKDRRDFSHGCIRLADPMALAMFVLKPHGDWDEKRVQEKIDTGKESHLKLQQPLPVIVTYLTAAVGTDGRGMFFRDVYGQDAQLQRALATSRP